MAMVCLELLDLMLLKSRILELLVLITPIIPSCTSGISSKFKPSSSLGLGCKGGVFDFPFAHF